MRKPSKLWRSFGATAPLFEVVTETEGTYNDDDIVEISTTRGSGEPFGLAAGSAQVTLRGVTPGSPWSGDTWLRVKLTAHGAARIVALTGGGDPLALAPRLTARRVSEEFEDLGDKRLSGGTLTFTAHDYAAAVSLLDRGSYALSTDTNVATVHSRAMIRVGYETPLQALNSAEHPWPRPWVPSTDALGIPTSEVFSKYAADIGVLVRITRAGEPQSVTHGYRKEQGETLRHAVAAPGSTQALQRRQVLSPIKWAKNASIPIRIAATWRNAAGGVSVYEKSAGEAGILDKPTELDLTHVALDSADLDDILQALIQRTAQIQFTPTDVTIDILKLLSTGRDDDRQLIRQIFLMEVGDPVALAADWPWPVGGIFYADRIAEKIAHDSYTVTLTLSPSRHVTGEGVFFGIAGRTWQQAYRSDWEAVPTPDTWANAPTTS